MSFYRSYLIPRIIQFLVVILVGTTTVFILPRLAPTDPIEAHLARLSGQGGFRDPAALEAIRSTLRELYGLEGSMLQQYGIFWRRLLSGDFGPSFSQFPTPVMRLIGQSLPWTTGLLLVSTLIAWIIGSILGGLAAAFPKARWGGVVEAFAMGVRPIPYYIMALFTVILLSHVFRLFPMAGGYAAGTRVGFNLAFMLDVVRHAFLPALSMVILGVGVWFLQMRSVASGVVGEDYVVYAETSGLPKGKIIFQYIMRNAILPQITGLGLSLGMIFGGALITEIVFSYPGIGTLLYSAINNSDYNLVMGITLLSIVAVATAVLIIDLIYPFFDPRVRYQ